MPGFVYRTAEESRAANIAYHLIPIPVWQAQKDLAAYTPEAYGSDGFIHLTFGLDPLVRVANMFYTGDSREYAVLVIDLARVEADIHFEDPDRIFPHIYGLLNTDAVIGELAIERDTDGRFIRIPTGTAGA